MPIEKSDLLQGTLDMLILKIVALGPVHGYGIALRIRQISKEVLQVQQGSLYPALHRLEKRGWLESAASCSSSARLQPNRFFDRGTVPGTNSPRNQNRNTRQERLQEGCLGGWTLPLPLPRARYVKTS